MSKPLARPDGEAIQQLRIDRGWSVRQLAKRVAPCGVSSVYHIEAGRPCKPEVLSRIARALRVTRASITLAEPSGDGEQAEAEAA